MSPEDVQKALRWFRNLWHEADKLATRVKPDTAERTDRAADVRREVEHLVVHCGSGLSTEARQWIIELIDTAERDWRRHVTQTGPAPLPPEEMPGPSRLEALSPAEDREAGPPTQPTPRLHRTQRPSWAVSRLAGRIFRPAT